MNNTTEKIRMFQSSSPSQWRRNAEKRLANQDERRNARKFAMQMLDAMEKQGITESELAKLLKIKKEELSSILKGHKLPSSDIKTDIESTLKIKLIS